MSERFAKYQPLPDGTWIPKKEKMMDDKSSDEKKYMIRVYEVDKKENQETIYEQTVESLNLQAVISAVNRCYPGMIPKDMRDE